MLHPIPAVRTVQGIEVPSFFYGTAWKEERTAELTYMALQCGLRAIDTANQRRHYVEAAVGEAVHKWMKETSAPREKVFLQTKFTYSAGQDHRLPYDPRAPFATQVAQSFQSSLEHLGVDCIDAYVLHGPSNPHGWSSADREVWVAMQELHDSGKARLLGVSNVHPGHLLALLREARVMPAFVQNRCFAATGWDRDVRELCRAHGIAYQAFSLLTANDRELHRRDAADVAMRTGLTIPQVVFRFAAQAGMIPLTGSCQPAHLQQDLQSFEASLGDRDFLTIERL